MECTCSQVKEKKAPWEKRHCFVVVTGASRGFGRAFCIELVKAFSTGSDHADSLTMLLLSRDIDAIQMTESLLYNALSKESTMHLEVLVCRTPLDMKEADQQLFTLHLSPLFEAASKIPSDKPQWNLLVHNAATLGSLQLRADERTEITDQDTYYHVNLTAPMVLTGVFLRFFAPAGKKHQPATILNISSLAAEKPMLRMSDYCIGKAARQMFLKCLAIDRPSLAVFNYSPGPLDTDMYSELINMHGDPDWRKSYAKNKETGSIVSPNDSARVCISWLRRQWILCDSEDDINPGIPQLTYCPVHDASYADLWQGCRLDYYDALDKT